MKILALDLSSARGSVACVEENRTLFDEEFANDRKHSGLFFEDLRACLDRHKTPDIIAVGLGPGSYAGTRIAISAAIGLQISSQAKLIGWPSICAIACEQNEYCVIGDARRESFYIAHVREHELIDGPDLLSEIELRDKIDKLPRGMSIFATEPLPKFPGARVCFPSAAVLAQIAQRQDRHFFLPPLEPIYLREPHITKPKAISR
ncbi:MAG: tRNA threonylcarbamoyladenosine biosynthesis protein TsaB [Verrucomicrobiota bacterium]